MKRIAKPLLTAKEMLLSKFNATEEQLDDLLTVISTHASELEELMVEYARQVLDHSKSQIGVNIRTKNGTKKLMNYNSRDINGDHVIIDINNDSIEKLKEKLK